VNYANSAEQKKRAKNRPILNDAFGEQFGELLYDACVNILTVTKGAVYICMSSSELDVLQKAFRAAGGHWSTFVIWAKNTFTLGRSDYPARRWRRNRRSVVWRMRRARRRRRSSRRLWSTKPARP
jgi:hypothetical protein